MTQGKATYVASDSDRSWLLNEQRKLYARSQENPDYIIQKLWGLVTDRRNLRIALSRVARNKGRRTAGVDVPERHIGPGSKSHHLSVTGANVVQAGV
jgi:hypothetical protein